MRNKGGALIAILVIVFIVAVGLGMFLLSGRNDGQDVQTPPIDSPAGKIVKDNGVIAADEIEDNENTLVAELVDVSGGTASGTGYVLREGGELKHKVVANLPELAGNNLYEGWLVQQIPELKFFSTGVMKKNAEGVYELNFESDLEYTSYNFVVITLETVVDATPEKHILEGVAK